jgi:putative hydrolase of the HAD superfamily
LSTVDTVIFDLDDTLFPEREYVRSGMRSVALWGEAELGLEFERSVRRLQELFEQGIRGNTFNLWLAEHGLTDEDIVASAIAVYRNHRPVIRVFPDVPGVLSALKVTYKLGLVSDGYLRTQQLKLDSLELGDRFDAVVFSDALGRAAWKPSPLPFLTALRQLGNVAPHTAVYVADNPLKDFIGAREAGVRSIRIRRPNGEYSGRGYQSDAHKPDRTITELSSLPKALLLM